MIVGTAEVMVVANSSAFRKELEDSTRPAFAGLKSDAEIAGADAGTGLRTGVKKEAGKLEQDLGALGSASGMRLREGVTGETGKLAGDMEKDGARAGEGLHKGMSGGLSKLAGLISATGLPLGALSGGLEKAGTAAEHADSKASSLGSTLDHVGGVALVGFAGAGAAVAAVGVNMAEKMQSADAAIAAAGGTSIKAATGIGNAFLGTAGHTEFGAQAIATAFAGVAGQLKSTQGRALDSSQALSVMNASMELATAKGIALGDSTSTVAGVMQAFQIKAAGAAHVSDVLFTASTATGQSVDALGASLEKVRAKLGPTAGSVGDLAGLLVDMTNQGVTGRAAMTGLNSGLNALEKTANGVTTATSAQKAAYDQMSPSLQKIADQYRTGSITAAQFTTATAGLGPAQAVVAKAFATATGAVTTAQLKYKEMGVTAFTATGQFVGMGSIIEQLHPKFAQMSNDQQLAAATTLFGAGAARQMIAVINAGPAAYDKATQSVNKMGAAHDAASKQASTLHVEEETLKAEMGDLATRVGEVLIPVITAMIGVFVKATTFIVDHKAALIALAAVVTGILAPAIAVFTINKMAAFGQSFVTAGGHVKDFASGVQTAVQKVIGLFTQQTEASKAAGLAIEENNAAAGTSMKAVGTDAGVAAGEVEAADTRIDTANATASTSFGKLAAGATEADTALVSPLALEDTEVGTADTTIGTDNTAAGTSFAGLAAGATTADTALIGPLAGEVTEVTAADTTIETENATAAASFFGAAASALKYVPVAGAGLALGYGLGKATVNPSQPTTGPTTAQKLAGLPGTVQGPSAPSPVPKTNVARLGSSLDSNTTAVKGHTTATQALTGVITAHASGKGASGEMLPGAMSGLSGFGKGSGKVQANATSGDLPGLDAAQSVIARQIIAEGQALHASVTTIQAALDSAFGESSFNPAAVNPTSGDSGVFQSSTHEPTAAQIQGWYTGGTSFQGGGGIAQIKAGNSPGQTATDVEASGEPASYYGQYDARSLAIIQAAGVVAPGTTTAPTAPAASSVPAYVNPLANATGVVGPANTIPVSSVGGRVDQGVDYTFSGPLGAIGTGVIEAVKTFQGFGTTIEERLTSGSHKGDLIYTALENGATLATHTGAHVTAGQQIATGLGTGGIEMGLAQGSGVDYGLPITRYAPGQSHNIPTSGGQQMAAFLASIVHGTVGTVPGRTPTGTPGGTPAGPTQTPAQAAAQTAAATAAKQLAATIKQTEASISTLQAALKHGTTTSTIDPKTGAVHSTHAPLTPAVKRSTDAELAALKANLSVELSQQKAALSTQTTDQKQALAKQTTDVKAGTTVMDTLLTAVHSGSMKTIGAALTTAHNAGLSKIEAALDHDHSVAMSALADKLNQVHKAAMTTYVSDQKSATAATDAKRLAAQQAADAKMVAATQATLTGLVATYFTNLATSVTAASATQSQQISDSTKVFLDQQAEAGLTGAALTAAQAQTSLDTITEQQNAAIAAAQAQVTAAAGGSAAVQAQAAALLAEAQGAAQVAEAQAQSVLDEANAAATAATTAATNATTAAAAAATQGNTLIADQAKAQADQIADSTKVYLDQQAQAGLTGASLVAAQAQTALDTVTMQQNQAIDQAQQGVDAASTGDQTAQEAAATLLAQAQATAQIQEAQAQSVLDKANAAANGAASPTGTTPVTTAPVPPAPVNFYITIPDGTNMTASQLLSEIGWSINTGALPVAPPVPVAA